MVTPPVERSHVAPLSGQAPAQDPLPGLELTVQRQRDGAWPVVAELSAGPGELPSRAEGLLRLDLGALYGDATDPRAYGQRLGAALFDGAVRDAFATALASSPSGQIRLLLTIEDPELAALRWERLCGPFGASWRHLALSQRVLFSRYEPSLADRRFPPIGPRDLRALVLAAAPAELPRYQLEPFDAARAASAVVSAIGPIPTTVLADGAAGPPSLEALCRQIVADAPTILHLICHGRARDDGESALFLASDEDPGKVRPVTGTELIERLAGLGGARGLPHLIVLASCESAAPAAAATLGSLAQRLVRELGTPAVVAMADKVSVATAEALAGAFYPRLAEHGHPDRALAEALTTLQGRDDALVPGLYGRLGGRPLFSDSLARPLTPAEIRHGLERLAPLVDERAPVLVPELAAAAADLRATLDVEATALSAELRREREAALTRVGTLCEEATELSFAALALGRPVPPYEATCPFPGLAAFQADERRFFFGREPLVARLLTRLAASPFLAVLGPSGSGKSSVVRAGLIPALQARHPRLAVTTVTPGAHPVARLRSTLSADLKAGPPGPRLILVDQLEELFTLCADEGERAAFIDQLLGLARKAPVVVTMRADFWGEVAPYPRLREVMQAGQELIGPLTPAELRGAIERQAAAVGLRFEAGLGGQILDDVAGEPGAMPLLQHALAELWRRRRGRWLRAAEYEAIGGVGRAIAHTADGIYQGLGEAERERLRDIFVRLTRLDPEAGEGARRDTRRRVALAELVPAGADAAATRELVRRLADARLVVTGVGASGAQEVEVAHEALIRAWPRLQAWLSEDRAGLRVREAVRQAALEWDEASRDDGHLVHRGTRLDEAATVAALPRFAPNARERAYLDACIELRERERAEEEAERQRELKAAQDLAEARAATVRRTRRLAAVVGVVALLAIGAAIVAGIQTNLATDAKTTAQRTARQARAGELAALAARESSTTPQLGALLAAEAISVTMDAGEPPAPAALEAIYATLGAIGGEGLATITAFADGTGTSRANPNSALTIIAMAAVSPDARYVLTGQMNGPLWLWDTTSPATPAYTLTLDGATPRAPTFSPDGRWLAAMGAETTWLWDLRDMARPPIPLPKRNVVPGAPPSAGLKDQLAFSADGAVVANFDRDGLRLYRLGGAAPEELGGDPAMKLRAISLSPDGALIAAAVEDNQIRVEAVRVWSTDNFTVQRELLIPPDVYPSTVKLAFSPDGRSLVVLINTGIGEGSSTQVLDLTTTTSAPEVFPTPLSGPMAITREGAIIADGSIFTRAEGAWRQATIGPWSGVNTLALSRAGDLGAAGMDDGRIMLFRTDKAPYDLAYLGGHEANLAGLSFTPDGRTLVSIDRRAQARRWDVTGEGASAHPARVAMAPAMHATGPGGFSAAWTSDASVKVLDLEATPPSVSSYAYTSDGQIASPDTGGVSADGRRALVTDYDNGKLAVLDLAPGSAASTLLELNTTFGTLSSDGRWLFVSDNYALYDLDAPRPARTPVSWQAAPGARPTFSPDGRWLMLVSAEGNGILWKLDGAAPEGPIEADTGLDDQLMGGAFSADGSRFAASSNTHLHLWDVSTGAPGRPIVSLPLARFGPRFNTVGGAWFVPSLAFSPDSRWLAMSGDSGAVGLVDLTSTTARTLQGHSGPVSVLAFSADGAWLATAGDSTVRLWAIEREQAVSATLVRLEEPVSGGPGPQVALVFRRDGGLVVLEDGEAVRLYTLDPAALVRIACAAAGRNLSPVEWQRTFPDTPYRPTCPDLPAHPELVDQHLVDLLDAADQGDAAGARAALAAAVALEPRLFVPAAVWHRLCRAELLAGEHAQALEHCEQAVAGASGTLAFHEARALARAMSNDRAGAAADLRVVAKLADQNYTTSLGDAAQLRAWAGQLAAGSNPFTPELVRELVLRDG